MATIIKLKRSETASTVPTTSNLAVGEVAVNTADRKIYMRDSSNAIVEIANAAGSNSFTTISVSGQSDIVADQQSDTLTLQGTGLTTVTTNAGSDTVTIGTSSGFSFVLRDGTSKTLDPSTSGTTLQTAVENLYVPFTTRSGASKTTLVLA
jgi:hypothetical protein